MSSLNERIKRQLRGLQTDHLLRSPSITEGRADGMCERNGRLLVNFGSNDYLGLASKLYVPANTRHGATASALVSGRSAAHDRLESALAEFEGTESALLFPTGYAANVGTLCGLIGKQDAVFCDRDNHASIIDGARLSGASLHIYRRTRLKSLRASLADRRADFDCVIIVSDGVFSMDGTVAPLAELCELAEQFDASVVVDEAHGTGVLGARGRGACELLGVEERVLARVGTMSKAMGGMGGFVSGSKTLTRLLRNTARTQFFSTALPPSVCERMTDSLQFIQNNAASRQRLKKLTEFAHAQIRRLALSTVPEGVAPIVPVLIEGNKAVALAAERLAASGFFVPAIRSPTVKAGTERLRISLSTDHREEQIVAALEQLVN